MELYRLLQNGAVNPEDGIYFGEKGQIVYTEKSTGYWKILSPKEGQNKRHFAISAERLEKL